MIRIQPLEGPWQVLGTDLYPGIHPQEEDPVWGPAGPESLSFSLDRPPGRVHADIDPWSPVEWYPGERAAGDPPWAGYVLAAPPGAGGGRTSVECVGWHYSRDDDPRPGYYVHDDLGDWKDTRSFLATSYLDWPLRMDYQSDGGVVSFGKLKSSGDWPQFKAVGMTLDLGPSALAKRVVVTAQRGEGNPGNVYLYVRGSSSMSGVLALPGTNDLLPGGRASIGGISQSAGGTKLSGTFTDSWRYVNVFLYLDGAAYTPTLDDMVRILGIKVFALAAYESGGESVLTADVGIKAARDELCPQLSQDNSQIAPAVFTIPHAAWLKQDATARERMDALNDYHGYRHGVDALKRVFFLPQPVSPSLLIDATLCDVADKSTNDGREQYNHVSVRGQSGSGEELRVDRWLADYLIDRMAIRPTTQTFVNPSFATDLSGWTNMTARDTSLFRSAPASGEWNDPSTAVATLTGTFVSGRTYIVEFWFHPNYTGSILWRATLGVNPASGTDYGLKDFGSDGQAVSGQWNLIQVVWTPDTTTSSAVFTLGRKPNNFGTYFPNADPRIDDFTLNEVVMGALGQRRRKRSFTLTVGAKTSEVAMDGLAKAWLLAHSKIAFKADLRIVSDEAVIDLVNNRKLKAHDLGPYYGQMVRIVNVPDPNLYDLVARDGIIASVAGKGPAQLAIDSERRSLEALLARMQVIRGKRAPS